MGPNVAKKNLVKHGGLKLVQSLHIVVSLVATEVETFWESSDGIFHFVKSVDRLLPIIILP